LVGLFDVRSQIEKAVNAKYLLNVWISKL